jgi:hypothetical protein
MDDPIMISLSLKVSDDAGLTLEQVGEAVSRGKMHPALPIRRAHAGGGRAVAGKINARPDLPSSSRKRLWFRSLAPRSGIQL